MLPKEMVRQSTDWPLSAQPIVRVTNTIRLVSGSARALPRLWSLILDSRPTSVSVAWSFSTGPSLRHPCPKHIACVTVTRYSVTFWLRG